MLCYRVAAAARACLTVDAVAAYFMLEGAAKLRPADGFFAQPLPIGFLHCVLPFSHRKLSSYHVYYHSFLQCRSRLRLEIRKKRIIF